MKSAAASAVASSSRVLRSALCSLPSTGLALEVFDSKFHLVDALAVATGTLDVGGVVGGPEARIIGPPRDVSCWRPGRDEVCEAISTRVTSTCMIRINSPQHGIHVWSCQRLSAPVSMFLG